MTLTEKTSFRLEPVLPVLLALSNAEVSNAEVSLVEA